MCTTDTSKHLQNCRLTALLSLFPVYNPLDLFTMYFYETNTLKCDVPANVAAGSGLTRGERNGPHIIKATGGIPLYPVNSICRRLITSSSSKCTQDKNTCKKL